MSQDLGLALEEHRGVVTAFDDHRGLGEVRDRHGRTWTFHCTAISDGTRTIDVGATVRFRLSPGHLGRMEARAVEVSVAGA